MAGKKKKAETIFLVCEESGKYNYSLRRKPGGEKLKLKKYCPKLPQAHAPHGKEEVIPQAVPDSWRSGGASIPTTRIASKGSLARPESPPWSPSS